MAQGNTAEFSRAHSVQHSTAERRAIERGIGSEKSLPLTPYGAVRWIDYEKNELLVEGVRTLPHKVNDINRIRN